MATSYYIIKKGSVMAVKGGKDVRKMVINLFELIRKKGKNSENKL